MKSRDSVYALMLTAALVAGCGGSDEGTPSDTVDSVVPDEVRIDYAEGAFERNEGTRSDPDGAPITSDDVTDPAGSGLEDAATTTSAPTGSTGDTGSSTGSVVTAVANPGEGIIVVGGVEYVFATVVCQFDAQSVVVEGEGTSTDFAGFTASIFYSTADIDADGSADVTLDVVIDFDGGATGEILPAFYASKVESETLTSGADIVVTVEGERIFGGGLMNDLNGVVLPVDQPAAMTFDALCS